jgi:tetratricopeptide (TPR) repeat protein
LIGLDAELREIVGLYAAGDLAEARARCQSLLRRRPGMRVALMTLAQIERDLGNLDAAVAAMRQAWELYPADTTALGLLVSYLTQAERAGEAVEVSAAHASEERPDLDVLFVRSLALARSAQHAAATATIEQARRLEPANPMVAVYAGTLALMDGQRQAARAAFEEALALDGATVRAHTALAILHTEEGRLDEAVAHWQEAVALDPREHAKLLAIGARLWSVGQTAQARPLLELFLESAPADAFGAEQERVRRMLTGAEAP